MIRGIDHFLGYPSYAQTPTDLCLGVVSKLAWVLEITTLSPRPLSLNVFVMGRPRLQTFISIFNHQIPLYAP